MRRLVAAVLVVLGSLALVASPASAAGRTIVIYLGGIASTSASEQDSFTPLANTLLGRGWSNDSLKLFNYVIAGDRPYTADDTCNTIASERDSLANTLRWARQQGLAGSVDLVGHSLGGIIALETVTMNADLASFVHRVVVVDAPIRGIGGAGLAYFGNGCYSAVDLYNRNAPDHGYAWQQYELGLMQQAMGRGTQFHAVVNTCDIAFGTAEDESLGPYMDWDVNVCTPNPFTVHSAALKDQATLNLIAGFLGSPGS